MKKLLFSLVAALMAVGTFAKAPDKSANGKPPPIRATKINPERLRYLQMRDFGGYVKDKREQRGKIVIVNAQTAAKPAWLDEDLAFLDKWTKFAYSVEKGDFGLANPVIHGSLSLFVVDDPKLPMSLFAPESRWMMVNVAQLKTDKEAFFEARVKKAVMRGMAYLLGAGDSQYPMNLTGCITKPEDYDQFVKVSLPVDQVGKFPRYLAGYGVTPYKTTTYKQSVHEGWGAQPTNEFQKAIWDEIHTLPTKPITIEPETK